MLVCFDEHGPVTPTPKAGRGWFARGRPRRIRVNYRKPHGVAFFFGVYDVGADQLFGRWFPRKGADNVIAMLKLVRSRYPAQRIWWVQDNLSSHWTPEVRATAKRLGIIFVPTPTYASWLNRIECQFGAMVKPCSPAPTTGLTRRSALPPRHGCAAATPRPAGTEMPALGPETTAGPDERRLGVEQPDGGHRISGCRSPSGPELTSPLAWRPTGVAGGRS